jgi:hypothetical protein
MKREFAAVVVAWASLAHRDLALAQAASQQRDSPSAGQFRQGPPPNRSNGAPPVNQPPSSGRRFESTLKFDQRHNDEGQRYIPLWRGRFAAPFVFVTPWLSDQMIHVGGARLEFPLPSGLAPGGVQLDVQPWRAQVYVDAAYAGVVEDFKGYYRHLEISAGPHTIVIAAPDYDPLVLDVLVAPGQVTTYRGTLNFALRH